MTYLEERRHQKQFGKPAEVKKPTYIKRVSDKKKAQLATAKESGSDAAMDKWFDDQVAKMTGKCLFCGGVTKKDDPRLARFSAAHLFAKRKNKFPSIKLHPENGVELCFFGNSCHTNFDNHMITIEDVQYFYPAAWFVIVEKTKILYPLMTHEEQGRVPEILINEL